MKRINTAWLAGFYDGEGHFSVHSSTRSKDKVWYQASIGLRNTHKPSIDHVIELLDELGVAWGLLEEKRSQKNANHKDSYWLNITGMKNILVFLEAVIPHLITKGKQATLMAEYCISRTTKIGYGGYTNRETEIQMEFKTINKRGT